MIKIAICDDDKNIINMLKEVIINYGKMYGYYFKIETFECGKTLEKILKDEIFDIIFLDIELNGILGIDIGNKLRENINNYLTKIIYVSSHTNYALAAYDTMPTDFIFKPLKIEKIEKSISNVLKVINFTKKEFIYTINRKINKVLLTDILYFESYRNIVKIYTIDGREDKFYSTLKQVMDSLNSQIFIQQHKSYIVNIEYISKIEKNDIILFNQQKIPISRYKIKYLKEMILSYERDMK